MKTEKIEELLTKYYEGNTSLEEEQVLREFFTGDDIPEKLKPFAVQFSYYDDLGKVKSSLPSSELFKRIEDNDSKRATKSRLIMNYHLFRIAASVALLIIGFAAGNWYARQSVGVNSGKELNTNKNVSSILTHFQRASASEQIKLINQVGHRSNTNEQVLHALIYTLNNDDNVNVRMAAAEALYHFKNKQPARESLINALRRESNPNMQITLIHLLVKMRVKKAVSVMQVLLLDNHLDKIVRNELEQGIGILS